MLSFKSLNRKRSDAYTIVIVIVIVIVIEANHKHKSKVFQDIHHNIMNLRIENQN